MSIICLSRIAKQFARRRGLGAHRLCSAVLRTHARLRSMCVRRELVVHRGSMGGHIDILHDVPLALGSAPGKLYKHGEQAQMARAGRNRPRIGRILGLQTDFWCSRTTSEPKPGRRWAEANKIQPTSNTIRQILASAKFSHASANDGHNLP